MRRVPSTLAALTALLALSATPAGATGCPMLTDVAGDGRWALAPIESPQLDILSADVASGPTTVSVVLRLASLESDHVDHLGVRWAVGFVVGGVSNGVYLRRTIHPQPLYISEFRRDNAVVGAVAFTFDPATATITWTVPRSAIPELATPGQVFHDIGAITTVFSSSADNAFDDSSTYVDQSPGCISAA